MEQNSEIYAKRKKKGGDKDKEAACWGLSA